MTWILVLTLATGLSGPVHVPEDACKMTAAMVAAGEPVFVELESGSVELVIDAKCTQEAGA